MLHFLTARYVLNAVFTCTGVFLTVVTHRLLIHLPRMICNITYASICVYLCVFYPALTKPGSDVYVCACVCVGV